MENDLKIIYVYMCRLNHLAVNLKHYKSTVLQCNICIKEKKSHTFISGL